MPAFDSQSAGPFSQFIAQRRQAPAQGSFSAFMRSRRAPAPEPGGFSLTEAAKGFGKKVLGRVADLGEFVSDIPVIGDITGAVGGAVADTLFPDLKSVETEGASTSLGLDPSNRSQEIGAGAEQIAEFLLPGGALKGAGLAARAGTEAAKAGVTSLSQGEDFAVPAMLGGAGPVVGRAVSGLAKPIRKLAEGQYQRALSPTTKPLKATAQRVVPELLDKRVHGSLENIAEKATEKVSGAGADIGAVYDAAEAAGKTVSTKPILAKLSNIKNQFTSKTLSGQPVEVNKAAIKQVEELERIIGEHGSRMSPKSLHGVRRAVDDLVGTNFAQPLPKHHVASIRKQARTAMQDALSKVADDPQALDELNAAYHTWKGVQDVAKATLARTAAQEKAFGRFVKPAVAAGIGSSLAGGEGLLLGLAARVAGSPRWRTWSAVQKAKIADRLAAGDLDGLIALLSRASAGGAAQSGP